VYKYLVQRIYEDEPVTDGPFTGYYFTGWHSVTRYDGTKPSKFLLPPGANLDGDTSGLGFEVTQMDFNDTASRADSLTETEESRVIDRGKILYGKPLYWGLAKIRRTMRQMDLMESNEGYGG
jgi:hypothetical protein